MEPPKNAPSPSSVSHGSCKDLLNSKQAEPPASPNIPIATPLYKNTKDNIKLHLVLHTISVPILHCHAIKLT